LQSTFHLQVTADCRGQHSVSGMLGLVVDDSLPLLLPQLDVDGTHNEALPLELDTISPYQIMRLELYITDWKPFVRDAKSAPVHLGRGWLLTNIPSHYNRVIIEVFMP